jgi:5-methylcytosine-specific restriction endonuclease McrA
MRTVKLTWHQGGSKVEISGTWNDGNPTPMTKVGDKWIYNVELANGIYEYKFFVDGVAHFSSKQPNITTTLGYKHNIVVVDNTEYKSKSLITIENDKNLVLKDIPTTDDDVKIVSILGSARMGKSTLFNTIISKYTNYNNNVFATSKGLTHCTHGIDYVYIPEMKIIFCDIQGLNSENSASDPKLLLIAYLMSDIIIYTEQKMLNKTTLQSLSPLSSFLTYLNQEDIDLRNVKPSLVFRISDFTLSGKPQENLDLLLTEHQDQSMNIVINMKKLFKDITAFNTNPLDRSELKMLDSGNFYGLLENDENGFDDFINEINNYLAGIPPRIKFSTWYNNMKHYIKQINENKKIDFNKLDTYQQLTKIELLQYENELRKTQPDLFIPLTVNHTETDNKKIQKRIKMKDQIIKDFKTKFGIVNDNLKNEIYDKLIKEITSHIDIAINYNYRTAYKLLTDYTTQNFKLETTEDNIDIENIKLFTLIDNKLKDIEKYMVNQDLTDAVLKVYFEWKKEIVSHHEKFKIQINDKQLKEVLEYENIVTSYLDSMPEKLTETILLKKYCNLTSVEFLLKTYDQYLEEIINQLISVVNKINVSQYNITFNCRTEKGVLKLDLTSSVRPSSNTYSYLKVKYDKTVEKIRALKKSYDVYKLYISKKTQILNNKKIYNINNQSLQITSDIARVNKDITEFHIIDGKWIPIFQIKRQNLLKLTIKKLVKDKIIYKNKDTYYIFGVKFNTYDEIYRKIIYYKTTPSSESIINRNMVIFNNKNIELMAKFNNYKTYQDQLNAKLKKAKELKAIYESQLKINNKKPEKKEEKKEVVEKPKVEKYKKKHIPKPLKKMCWDIHIGSAIGSTKCLCCKHQEIRQIDFHCGHVIAEKNGGSMTIDNLRPICSQCNLSMGVQNMDEFKKCFESKN